MTTNPDLDQARKWAKDPSYQGDVPSVAAAHVIAALPDEWIDADKLREALDWRDSKPSGDDYDGEFYDRLRALLPTPQPRTLADMTREEREACRWSLVETPENEGIFIKQHGDGAMVIYPSGRHIFWGLDEVVPMLDMPRLEWPGHHPATEEGRPEPAQPRPEDVPAGELWIVEFDGQQCAAERELPGTEKPWWLMIGWRVSDEDVTLVSRLVPEVQA